MVPQNQDRRECAFWIDAADSALARWQQANAAGEVDAVRRVFSELISISCRAPQSTDQDVAQVGRRLDEQLRAIGDPALLRIAFAHWPTAAEWNMGDYAALIERAKKIAADDSVAETA